MFQSVTFASPQFPIPSLTNSSNRKLVMRCNCKAAVQWFAEPDTRAKKPASFYEVLCVKRNASTVEIRAAYRRLAKLHHPDAASSSSSSSSDGRDFIQIHSAYETLSDPAARALYDLSLTYLGLGIQSESKRERRCSSSSMSFGGSPVARRPTPTRRWETDQCW